ncbi:MAG: hypothetical protein ACLTYN_09670 [Dysosmobacter welbionis]
MTGVAAGLGAGLAADFCSGRGGVLSGRPMVWRAFWLGAAAAEGGSGRRWHSGERRLWPPCRRASPRPCCRRPRWERPCF